MLKFTLEITEVISSCLEQLEELRMSKQIRTDIIQGDVILRRIDLLPSNLKQVKQTEKTGLVVQFSEVTGHHHHFRGEADVELYEGSTTTQELARTITEDLNKFLVVKSATKLYHGKSFTESPSKDGSGDHDSAVIDPGIYQILITRTFDYNRMESVLVRD